MQASDMLFAVGDGAQLGRFTIIDSKALGAGSYGTVIKVEDRHTRRVYAAKIFMHGKADCQHELKVYASLAKSPHETSLSIFGAHADKAFSWIVLPWIPGTLAGGVSPALADAKLFGVANQIRAGVRHLHSIGWLHMDIKPHNVLYDSRMLHVWLCDFSLCEPRPYKHAQGGPTTWCTAQYRPPELWCKPCWHFVTPEVDAWSIGCTVFEAGHARLFPEEDPKAVIRDESKVRERTRVAPRACLVLTRVLCCQNPRHRWRLTEPFPWPGLMEATV